MSALKDQAMRYFAAFANKDAAALGALLAEGVTLKDWELEADGKAAVLRANQNIFDAVQTVSVTPTLLVEENGVVAAQLEIMVNGTDLLRVVDLLHFDDSGKICKVLAYKG